MEEQAQAAAQAIDPRCPDCGAVMAPDTKTVGGVTIPIWRCTDPECGYTRPA